MKQFAKLFEMENKEQVLVTRSYDAKLDKYYLIVRSDIGGIVFEVKMEFDEEDTQVDAFKNFKEVHAYMIRKNFVRLYNKN